MLSVVGSSPAEPVDAKRAGKRGSETHNLYQKAHTYSLSHTILWLLMLLAAHYVTTTYNVVVCIYTSTEQPEGVTKGELGGVYISQVL